MLNPYFFMRTVALVIGDIAWSCGRAWQQRRKDVQPRLNRLHKFYPVLRAATTVFMRDVQAYLVMLDIVRGSPAIYFDVSRLRRSRPPLRPMDDGRLQDAAPDRPRHRPPERHHRRKAPRPYELLILSDHGQSFGATFKQRYGVDLKEFIEQPAAERHDRVADDGRRQRHDPMESMCGELDNVQDKASAARPGGPSSGGTRKI